jgi:hypothetical protein
MKVILIQDYSGGKVNILGGDSIGHCEEKSSYELVPNSELLPTESCLTIQHKSTAHGNKGKDYLLLIVF